MYLVYFDETGNTGTNFEDAQQQVFVLGALVVPEAIWQDLEKDLQAAVDKAFPQPRPEDFEIHGGAMRNGQGYFRGFSVADRMAFRDRWLAMARQHGVKLIYRAIDKGRFRRWVHATLGSGVKINPYVVAFPLVARVVDEYLAGCPERPLAAFVRRRSTGAESWESNPSFTKATRRYRTCLPGWRSSKPFDPNRGN